MNGPAFGLGSEIRPSALDADEGNKDVGGSGLSWLDGTSNELSGLGEKNGRGRMRMNLNRSSATRQGTEGIGMRMT